jgi:hypothetical protein
MVRLKGAGHLIVDADRKLTSLIQIA